jgi:hypothetical protein
MPERTEMPGPTMGQRFENLGGLASRAYENLSVQGAIDAAKGIVEGIVSGGSCRASLRRAGRCLVSL